MIYHILKKSLLHSTRIWHTGIKPGGLTVRSRPTRIIIEVYMIIG